VDRGGYVAFQLEWSENISDVKVVESLLMGWQQALGRLPKEVVGDRGTSPKRAIPSPLVFHIHHVALQPRGARPDPDGSKQWFNRIVRKRVLVKPVSVNSRAIIGCIAADARVLGRSDKRRLGGNGVEHEEIDGGFAPRSGRREAQRG